MSQLEKLSSKLTETGKIATLLTTEFGWFVSAYFYADSQGIPNWLTWTIPVGLIFGIILSLLLFYPLINNRGSIGIKTFIILIIILMVFILIDYSAQNPVLFHYRLNAINNIANRYLRIPEFLQGLATIAFLSIILDYILNEEKGKFKYGIYQAIYSLLIYAGLLSIILLFDNWGNWDFIINSKSEEFDLSLVDSWSCRVSIIVILAPIILYITYSAFIIKDYHVKG
jgi:hypothetical protein